MFPAEVKSKMSVEEQNERIRRNQSSSVRDKRRSLNLSNNQNLDGVKPSVNYRVVSIYSSDVLCFIVGGLSDLTVSAAIQNDVLFESIDDLGCLLYFGVVHTSV